ncbi:hypothetical protein GCM10022224_089980 [Nonomuraea antimicrobica]|uniref:DUF4440 domain-containing protein n=1 Tax=Nonomuraea antimicrobica TaxID=561173 RepID=A0ABP7DUG6_9ACTN
MSEETVRETAGEAAREVAGETAREAAREAAREVARHHRVIERWLTGAATRSEFAAFADAHAPGFTLIGPDGTVLGRQEVLALVEAAHGGAPGLTITIENARVVAESGDLLIVTYEERHHTGDGTKARRATATLGNAPAWRWWHLHETWLP